MKVAEQSLFSRARPLMLARGLASGISFVIPLALARKFSMEDYVTYKLFLLVAQTLYYVLPFGMAQSLYYFLPRSKFKRVHILCALSFLTIVGVIAMLVVMLLGARIGILLNNAAVAQYLLALGIYVLGIAVSLPLEISLTATGKTKAAAAVYVLSDLVKAALMTVPALLDYGLKGVVNGIAIFGALRFLAAWTILYSAERGPLFSPGAVRDQVRYALPFGAAIALAIPQQYFHQFVVSSHLDAASFALYAVGIFQLPIIDLVYTPTSEILMVRIGELERENRASQAALVFGEAVSRLAILFIPLSVFLMIAAPEMITTLFTERYLGAVPVFRVIAFTVLLAILPVDGALRACNQTRHIFISYLLKAIVTIPLVLLGVAKFGIIGGAVSWLATETIGKLILFAKVPTALRSRIYQLLPIKDLWRVALASMIAIAGIITARKLAGNGVRPVIALAAASLGYLSSYLLALAAVGIELPLPKLRSKLG